jgi:hypothetical protein
LFGIEVIHVFALEIDEDLDFFDPLDDVDTFDFYRFLSMV